MSRRRAALFVLAAMTALSAVACSDQQVTIVRPGSRDSAPAPTIPLSMRVRPSEPFPASRCQRNREFGPITYLTNANYTASAGVIDVIVAKAQGYFDMLCLDVTVVPSFATENYPMVAGNEAQFATAGSFSEIVDFAGRNNARFVALAVDGRVPLETLIVKPGTPTDPAQLRGASLAVLGGVTPAVAEMLARAGLQTDGADGQPVRAYTEIPVETTDPVQRLQTPGAVGMTGSVSVDIPALTSAGIPFATIDPADHNIQGSFGVLYTNATFAAEFPTVVEDVLRAASRGLADALADPAAAVDLVERSVPIGTPWNRDVELARWKVESTLIRTGARTGAPNMPDHRRLGEEIDDGAATGLFDGVVPELSAVLNDAPLRAVHTAGGSIVWPKG